ncbi:hypothetical protein ACROYT_G036864 [Oculina patagonica]
MKEAKEGVVRFEMFNESVMAATLEFIYTGSVPILTRKMAEGLIVMADYLLLPRLKSQAEEIAMEKLNASNCFSTCKFAERYQCEELVSKTQNFILANFTTAARTEAFFHISSNEAEKWISSNEIHVSGEEDVFKIILSWIEHDKDERKKYFANLFRHVRLAYVSRDFLCRDILTNDYVKTKKSCLNMVMDAVSRKNVSATPRKSQQTPAIVACVHKYVICYFPREHRWCELGVMADSISNLKDCEIFSCHGKLYFLQLAHSELKDVKNNGLYYFHLHPAAVRCYDTLSNCWTRQQYKDDGRYVRQIFVRNEDDVYALVSDGCRDCENLSCICYAKKKHVSFLTKYNHESNEWLEISSFNFGSKEGICIVAKDNFIYFIGGGVRERYKFENLHDVERYDVKNNRWDKVADVQEGRMFACGAATKDRLIVAGGLDPEGMTSNTCEMYNETTNEWLFIANLSSKPNFLSSMVCCDDKVYVLGGCYGSSPNETIECYDPVNDEWKEKTKLPFRIPLESRGRYFLHACSMTFFTPSLSNIPITWLSRPGRRDDKHKCVTM